MTIEMPDVQMDATETALDYARVRLGAPLIGNLKVFVSESNAMSVRRIQAAHGFELVVVPEHLFHNPYVWGAQYSGNHFWSKPL